MGIYDRRLHQSVQSFLPWTTRESRYAVATGTTITTRYGTSASALILNVSNRGCRIRTSLPLRPGERLTLLVEPHGKVEGEVCWTSDSEAGLRLTARDPYYGDYQLSYPA